VSGYIALPSASCSSGAFRVQLGVAPDANAECNTYNTRGTKSARGKTAVTRLADGFLFAPTFVRGDSGQMMNWN
jgi:hypothetical protein